LERDQPSLISVTHKTILESLRQRGALAIGGFGALGRELQSFDDQNH
jgi:hypothetical protein